MKKHQQLQLIRDTGVIAIMRANNPDLLVQAAEALLEIVPVGGVDINNAGDFIRAGATAVGVGNSLANQMLLDSGDMAEITRRAELLVDEVNKAR